MRVLQIVFYFLKEKVQNEKSYQDGFIQHYIKNAMALELKIEDTFTYKKGKTKAKKMKR